MVSALRAELHKLLTIRSTYILSIVSILLCGFVGFWAMGYKGDLANPHLVMDAVGTATFFAAIFISIIGILLVTHEYRYNTIMYTLTASNNRSKVLLAKILVMIGYTLAFLALASLIVAGLCFLGASIHGDLVAQQFFYKDLLWRLIAFMLGYMLMGLLFAVLFRHVVGAITTFLILPGTVESLLALVLKENVKYLPFTALGNVAEGGALRPVVALGVFAAYLVVGWSIAWTLFVRRDAN